jgi:hypothetical protein
VFESPSSTRHMSDHSSGVPERVITDARGNRLAKQAVGEAVPLLSSCSGLHLRGGQARKRAQSACWVRFTQYNPTTVDTRLRCSRGAGCANPRVDRRALARPEIGEFLNGLGIHKSIEKFRMGRKHPTLTAGLAPPSVYGPCRKPQTDAHFIGNCRAASVSSKTRVFRRERPSALWQELQGCSRKRHSTGHCAELGRA